MKPQPIVRTFVLIFLALAWPVSVAAELPSALVETGWLADHQGDVVVLDVRKDTATFLGEPPRPDEKPDLKRITGHIPGAVLVPWKRMVAKTSEDGVTLKAMLPTPESFAELMRRSGVGNDSTLVIAGLGRGVKDQAQAARLYFTLKYFGHDKVALLEGGTAQWIADGRPLAYGPETPPAGDFEVTEVRTGLLADTKAIEDAVADGAVQLVDCRTEDRYLGLNQKQGFVDPGSRGHLPGAKTLPFVLVGNDDGPARLFTPERIRDVATLKGIDLSAPTIAYCDTGVAASLVWLALHEIIGNEQVSLYDGSMHAWSRLAGTHPVVALEQMRPPEDETRQTTTDESLEPPRARPLASLQTLVDQRRDALRERRERRFEALTGRHFFQPAWIAAREEMLDGYRDSVRQAQRRHRDTMRLYRDTYTDVVAPWSRPPREWAELRQFLLQMDQLDREEYLDRFGPGYAFLPW